VKDFLIIVFIAGVAILSITACGVNDETASVSNNEVVDANATGSQAVEEAPPTTSATEEPIQVVPGGESLADVFDFYFRGAIIVLNQNMTEVLDALGEPTGVRQTPSCAFDGYDRIFGFGAINVHTYPVGDQDFVQIISIRDDSVTTRSGIRLGDSWDRVLDAYGSDYVQDFSIFTFTKGSTTLSFFVDDSMVVEITYALIMD